MSPVSVVIACSQPACDPATLASARAQTVPDIEVFIAADRNEGFQASQGEWLLSLPDGDVVRPDYARVCLQHAATHPNAAFFYTDSAAERLPDYNTYDLLDSNPIPSTAFIRKASWKMAGGYDPQLTGRDAEWEFWLRLAGLGLYGNRIPHSLFTGRRHHPHRPDPQTAAYIRSRHAPLYTPETRGRIKAKWSPAVRVVGSLAPDSQTIYDWDTAPAPDWTRVLATRAAAFVFPDGTPPAAHAAESSALAIWGGTESIALPDGTLAVSRRSLENCKNISQLRNAAARVHTEAQPPQPRAGNWPAFVWEAHDQLTDAGILSRQSWTTRPLRTVLRLIPLRVKETINRVAGQPVFDLSFYLQFQPLSLENIGVKVARLHYAPKLGARRRIALITPHLGPGGAENVLLEMARSLDRNANEIFLIATNSRDARWAQRWQQHADHVYDLGSLMEPEALPSALYSLVLNWAMDTVVIQNSLVAYSLIPHWKKEQPQLRIVDLVHAVGGPWDIASVTAPVAADIDMRIVISEAARKHLVALDAVGHDIRVIPNGVDLERFRAAPMPESGVFRIVFAARLDPVKRPVLLADIARALSRMHPPGDFRFIVAGDGRQEGALRRRIRSAGVDHLFELRGYVEDMAPLLAQSDVVLVTSSNEGIPLTIVEAFASARPVVASRAGAIEEIVDENTGILIDRRGDEAAAFARALARLMADPDLRRRMGIQARRRAELLYNRQRSLELYQHTLAPQHGEYT